MRSDIYDTIFAWAMREMAPWYIRSPRYSDAIKVFYELNAVSAGIALYKFGNGTVAMEPKPERSQFTQGNRTRADEYLNYFQSLSHQLPIGFSTTLCMNIVDEHHEDDKFPIFGFQKKVGALTPLLPDIDFITHNFYVAEDVTDTRSYKSKTSKAVFSGATTGGPISTDVIKSLGLPRLRAAEFFVGHMDIDFRLPSIVQYTTEEAKALLELKPYCRKPRMSWPEQLERKFIISMDGNGATCSRVVIALLSNSVLLKYKSDNVLFYFGGLQPWLHYVPVSKDDEVEGVMNLEGAFSERFESIAFAGQRFARDYLSRTAIDQYTLILLNLYAGIYGEMTDGEEIDESTLQTYQVIGHIENRDDVTFGPGEWVGMRHSGLKIEGLAIVPFIDVMKSLVYQVLLDNGQLSEKVQAGQYCGTRGQNRPIYGICLPLPDQFITLFDVSYEAYFLDGSHVGPMSAPNVCRAPSFSPLEAFKLTIRAR